MVTVRQMHGGWGSWTFLVDGDHILRFSRSAAIARTHRREAALLPLLAPALSFAVPRPDFFVEVDGRSCLGYPCIEGRAFTDGDDWRAIGPMLRELHDFPADRAAAALGDAGTTEEWAAYYRELWPRIEADVLPVLPPARRDVLSRAYRDFLAAGFDFTPVLVHRDLAPEHILVDDATGRPVGMIDFEDATVGDPAVDFAGLLGILGPARTEEVLADYGRPVDRDRMRRYWWLVPVHELLHGVTIGDRAIVAEALALLDDRLSGCPTPART